MRPVDLDPIALASIQSLGSLAYSGTIRREVNARNGEPVARWAVYASIRRLERAGHVTVSEREAGDSRRRYVTITEAGIAALGDLR